MKLCPGGTNYECTLRFGANYQCFGAFDESKCPNSGQTVSRDNPVLDGWGWDY